MKRSLIILLAAASLLLSSCSANYKAVPKELDKLTTKTQKNHKDYSAQDWETTAKDYDTLINEFWDNYDKYTDDQRKEALTAIGQYHIILLKEGLSESAEALSGVMEVVPGYIDGLKKTLEENKDAISSTLNELKDAGEEIGKSLEELGSSLGSIFEELLAE